MSNAIDSKKDSDTTYQPWSDVVSFGTFDIQFSDSGAGTAAIYGNNLNQVAVTISLQPLDKNSQSISVSPSDIYNHTRLVDYVTGEELNWNSSPYSDSPWCFAGVANDFCGAVQYDDAVQNNVAIEDTGSLRQVTYYIYWSTSTSNKSNSKQVAINVDLSDGTYITSCKDGEFHNALVNVMAIPQKAYTTSDLNLVTTDQNNGAFDCVNYYWSINNNDGCYILEVNSDPAMSYTLKYQAFSWTGDADYAVNVTYPGLCLYSANHKITSGFVVDYYTNIGILWKIGAQTTLMVPATTVNGPVSYSTTINEMPGAMCLTRNDQKLQGAVPDQNLVYTMNQKNNVTIYDQYGNSGYFHFTVSNWEDPSLNDGHA